MRRIVLSDQLNQDKNCLTQYNVVQLKRNSDLVVGAYHASRGVIQNGQVQVCKLVGNPLQQIEDTFNGTTA